MMEGTIIANMSGRKLAMLSAGLVICQILSFLAGAIMCPAPRSTDQLLATKCYDPDGDPNKWFYPRGKRGCRTIWDIAQTVESIELVADNVVFTFQMPLPRDGTELDYSRCQQNLIGVLTSDISYKYEYEKDIDVTVAMKIDARLGYRNKGDAENDWKEYARSSEEWNIGCSKDVVSNHYNCSTLPLFDLGALYHDFYLLNIRLHLDNNKVHIIEEEEIAKQVDLWLLATIQNGGYTIIMVSMKTVFFLIIALEMIWFWRCVTQMTRPPNRLEKELLVLGAALMLLNLPLEYLTLAFNMPWFSILDDIRQGLFYADLFLFWVIFVRHINDEEEIKSAIKRSIWKIFPVMSIICLFVGPICQRAALLHNPLQPLYSRRPLLPLPLQQDQACVHHQLFIQHDPGHCLEVQDPDDVHTPHLHPHHHGARF